jgi:hypothetical protein
MSIRSALAGLAALTVLATSCSAYIDPGTGGMIVGGLGGAVWPIIAAFFAGIAGILVKFFSPIKRGLSGLLNRITGKK